MYLFYGAVVVIRPMTPFDYNLLNPGIRETVRWFHNLGYTTTDSGDGKTRQFECDRPDPYVVVKVKNPRDLVAVSKKIFLDLGPVALRPEVIITGTYGPKDGLAHVDITGVHDGIDLPELKLSKETTMA